MVKYIMEVFPHQEPPSEEEEKGETFYGLKAIIKASLLNKEGVEG
jgi:hypothetical protein